MPATPFVAAELQRDCSPSLLNAIEQEWAEARVQVGGLVPLDHAHWDWRNKIDSVETGHYRLVAVKYEEQSQGLMAVTRTPRPAALSRGSAVYIDYLEVAPWNLKVTAVAPRFLGVGTILLIDAIRLSQEEGHEGRIGLHSQ